MKRKKEQKDDNRLVYSTNPDSMADLFANINLNSKEANDNTAMGKSDEVRVWIDRKRKGGKSAVVIKGIRGTDRQLNELATFIKTKCGVGGAAKNGEIIIQGDRRDRVVQLLLERGYTNVKKAGG